MSFVEVLPVEPVIPTTSALAAVAHGAPDRGHGGEVVVRDERGGGAGLARLLEVGDPAADRDEEIARPDPARVDLDAGDLLGRRLEPTEPLELSNRKRDHAGAPSRRSASRATSRSSNGSLRSANSCPCSWPLPAMTTTSPSRGAADRLGDRGSAVGLDLGSGPTPGKDLVDDRERILASRVVRGHDRRRPRARRRSAPSRPLAAVPVAAARRRRRSDVPSVSSRAVRRTFASESGVCE